MRKPATQAQHDALSKLLPFLQERYRIPPERIYAHNWIDYKDARYCEGCELARGGAEAGLPSDRGVSVIEVAPTDDLRNYRTNSRIARSSPSSVSGYIRPPINCRIMRIDCV